MPAPGSPRKQQPFSPARGHKRKASEPGEGAAGTAITSPFKTNYATSSTASSPQKRVSVSSSSRRSARQARTFRISGDLDLDRDQDAFYDEDLDAEGEDDEDYFDRDAEGEDDPVDEQMNMEVEEDNEALPKPSTSAPPSRQSARPKRTRTPNTSYYALQPPPNLSDDDEEDENRTPLIRRRTTKTKPPPASDIDVDTADNDDGDLAPTRLRSTNRGTHQHTPLETHHGLGEVPRQTSSDIETGKTEQRSIAKLEEPEMTEEEKQQAKAEDEAEELRSRWREEYFEIVEQLPLEVHRAFALMRELEGQMQARFSGMIQGMVTYRDARLELQRVLDDSPILPISTQQPDDNQSSLSAGSEDEAENLLGGSQGTPIHEHRPSLDDSDGVNLENASTSSQTLDKSARLELLRSISLAANEAVKVAEEKMGLAATAYNWIDRHIRRLDTDISKLESSILLGLRTGTEESRGAREALGLPVDDEAIAEGQDADGEGEQAKSNAGISPEAESAALTKAAGAANRANNGNGNAVGGRRSARTTPKMGGQAQLDPSPGAPERTRATSRSPSAGAALTGEEPTATAAGRTTRKRKPKPLSPLKGGRRSVVTNTSSTSLISPTSQTPRETTTTTVGPDVSEMPYDPTEPTYCYCDQVSFDEMVACDNDDCDIEWFHYACVGLTSQPRHEWYCRFCAPKGWKGPGMGVPANAKHKPPGFKKGIGIKP